MQADNVEERLLNLERDQTRLLRTLQESGFDIPVAGSADGELDRSLGIVSQAHKVYASRSRSPRWQDFGSKSEDEQEAVRHLYQLNSETDTPGAKQADGATSISTISLLSRLVHDDKRSASFV